MTLPVFLMVVIAAVVHHAPIAVRNAHVAQEAPLQTEAPRTTPGTTASSAGRCPDVLDVDAARVVTGWSGMMGRRVRLPMRIDRAVDFTLAIGVSGRHRFALGLSPDATWTGMAAKVFVVTGCEPSALAVSPCCPS